MKMKQWFLGAVMAAGMGSASHAALVAGDINVIGYRADADDAIAFVTWQPLSAGTTIYFTDSGFFDDGTMRDSENIMSWTAPTGGIVAGTVVVIASPNGSSSADTGSTTGALDGLSASGDQVFVGDAAFTTAGDTTKPGSAYSGNFLYGLDFNGTAGWDADATSSNTSALPSALSGVNLNFSIAHVDNAQYTGSRTGLTIDQFKTLIHNSSNWTTNDDGATFGALSSTDFQIVPEPGSFGLAAAGLLLIAKRRRTA